MLSTVENLWLKPHPKLDGISLMDHLFNRMDGLYPNRWQANFKTDSAIQNWKESWAEAFDEEGLMPQDIAQGIKNCRRMFDWPPSLTEFLRACRPYLEPEAAHQVAVDGLEARTRGEMGQWPHPALYWAAVKIGDYDMRNQGYGALRARWEKALSDELAKKEWAQIPEPMQALPEPASTEASKEVQQQIKRAVNDMSRPRKNPKQWALNILNNPSGKASMAVSMAQQALEPHELISWAQKAVDSAEHCKRAKQIAQDVIGKEAA